MADPASILGLIAASLTITIRAATIGKDLHTLISKFQTANSKVRQLSVHVAAVRVAARSLSSWLEDGVVGSEEVEDVKSELLEVLSACGNLLSDLQDHVAKALVGAEENVSFRGTVHYIWDEDIIKETTETLHHQETVLILMLQALERLTSREQAARLREDIVVQTLTKAKRPSSSIFGLHGDNRSSTRFSYASETSAKIDAVFTFDMEVMSSTSYRNAFTSLFRRNLLRQNEEIYGTVSNRSSTITVTATGHLQEEASMRSVFNDPTSLDDDVSTSRHISTPRTSRPDTPPSWVTSTFSPNEQRQNSGPERFTPKKTKVDVEPWKRRNGRSLFPLLQMSPPDVFCRVLYDFEGSDSTSLSMRKDEIIQVTSTLRSATWWEGILNGRRGFFPSNFCELIPDPLRSKFDDSDESNDGDEMWPVDSISQVAQAFASTLPIDSNGAQEKEKVMLSKEENVGSMLLQIGTAMNDERCGLAKPHHCAKGERCAKWRKQRRQLARMQSENHVMVSENTEKGLLADFDRVQEGPIDVKTWMASVQSSASTRTEHI
jgi:hypothetical protein